MSVRGHRGKLLHRSSQVDLDTWRRCSEGGFFTSSFFINMFQAVQAGLGFNQGFASSIFDFEAGVRRVSDAPLQEFQSMSDIQLDEFQSLESVGRRPTI